MTVTQETISEKESTELSISTQQNPQPKNRIFNRADRFAQGWYWAMRSCELKANARQELTLLGKEIVLYRDKENNPVATDAHSPTQSWPIEERYGLIWIWIGLTNAVTQPLPQVPELGAQPCDAIVSDRFSRKCHPNVLLINAIDAHHFNSVHNLPLEIRFETTTLSKSALQFNNITRGGEVSRFVRLIRPLYKKEVTYRLCYWYGNTGTVTLGPDFLHFYLMFALRPGENGTTEGQMVLLTPERSGLHGKLFNRIVLGITQIVANYFAKGDRHVFDSIKFDFKVPLAADRAILEFIKHVDQQPALTWKTWSSS